VNGQIGGQLALTPLELLERLSKLVPPPRAHKHRYCGILAPNARLRRAVVESAAPSGATVKIPEDAGRRMGLEAPPDPDSNKPTAGIRTAAARCWALLQARMFECLPLRCPRCGEPMRFIAFVLDRKVIERILDHIGEPTDPTAILPARSPPQGELDFARAAPADLLPEVDQTVDLQDAPGE